MLSADRGVCCSCSMENIELFNLYAGRIFARLYAAFPIARTIQHVDTINPPEARADLKTDTEDYRNQLEIASATVLWLADTGYLIVRGTGSPDRYVLSPKALEALNASVPALSPKEPAKTLGEQLTEVTKDVGSEAKTKAIGEIVGQVIGAAFKSLAT